jgi:hypothetical protein
MNRPDTPGFTSDGFPFPDRRLPRPSESFGTFFVVFLLQIILFSGVLLHTTAMNTLTIFLMFGLASLHPVHVSYTNLDITPETGEINLVYKFFTDDIKLLFYHLYDRDLLFDSNKDLTSEEIEMTSGYLFQSFILKEKDNQVIKFNFTRKEQNEEFIWLYFKGKLFQKNTGQLILTNRVLLDLFEDQTNLVILSSGNYEKGFHFNYLTTEITMKIDN